MRCSMVSAGAHVEINANASTTVVLRISHFPALSSFQGDAKHRTRNLEIPGLVLTHQPGMTKWDARQPLLLLARHLLLAVGDAVDGAVPVVADQDRPILHRHHTDCAAAILVSSDATGEAWT